MARHLANCQAWWKRAYYWELKVLTLVQHNLLPQWAASPKAAVAQGVGVRSGLWWLTAALRYHLLVLVGRKESQFIHDLRCRAVFLQLYVYTHPNWLTPVDRLLFLVAEGPRDPLRWLAVTSVAVFVGTVKLPLGLRQRVLYSRWSCVPWGQHGFSTC